MWNFNPEDTKSKNRFRRINIGEDGRIIIKGGLYASGTTEEGRIRYEKYDETITEISTKEQSNYNPTNYTLGSELEVYIYPKEREKLNNNIRESLLEELEAKQEAVKPLLEFITHPYGSIEDLINNIIDILTKIKDFPKKEDFRIFPFSFWPLKEKPEVSPELVAAGFTLHYGRRFFELYLPSALQFTLRIGREPGQLIYIENYLKNFLISVAISPILHILSQASPIADSKIRFNFENGKLIPAEFSHRILNLHAQYTGAGYGALQIIQRLRGVQDPVVEFEEILDEAAQKGEIRPPIGLRRLAVNDFVRLRNGDKGDVEISACDNAGFRLERIRAIYSLTILIINILNKLNLKQLLSGFPPNFQYQLNNIGVKGKKAVLTIPSYLMPANLERTLKDEPFEEYIPANITSVKWVEALLKYLEEESEIRVEFIKLFGEDYLPQFIAELRGFIDYPEGIKDYYIEGKGTLSEAVIEEIVRRVKEDELLKQILDKLTEVDQQLNEKRQQKKELEKQKSEVKSDEEKAKIEEEIKKINENIQKLTSEKEKLLRELQEHQRYTEIVSEVINDTVEEFYKYLDSQKNERVS